jgi:hypothetical protein
MANDVLASEYGMLDLKDADHAHADHLEMYVRGRLESRYISVVEDHLLKCGLCRADFFNCIGLHLIRGALGKTKSDRPERRSEPRFEIEDEAICQILNPFSVDRQIVKILDISENGMGILAPYPAPLGSIVQIRAANTIKLGEVRHSSMLGDKGYRIGLRLHVGF